MCVCEDESDISIIAEDRKDRRSGDYDFSDKQVDEKLKIHYFANILMINTLKPISISIGDYNRVIFTDMSIQ